MVHILFTKSSNIGSYLIRKALDSPASHCAIMFDHTGPGRGIVFHSATHGVEVNSWWEFSKSKEVVFAFKLGHLTFEQEEAVYQELLNNMAGKPYDWFALLYWIVAMFRKWIFGVPLPSFNPWGVKYADLCTAVLSSLEKVDIKYPKDLEMSSPFEIVTFLREEMKFELSEIIP